MFGIEKDLQKKTLGVRNIYIAGLLIAFLLFGTAYGLKLRQQSGDLLDDVTGGDPLSGIGSSGSAYAGNIQPVITEQDILADAEVAPTTPSYMYFNQKPSGQAIGQAVAATGTTVNLPASANGKFWMVVYGGTDFYVARDKIIANNPNIKQVLYEDYDGDDDKDVMFEYDASDAGITGQNQAPVVPILLPLVDIDVTSWADGNPADQTGLGETETVVTIDWDFSGITALDGGYITEIYVTTNDTLRGNDVRLESLTLTGGWVQTSGAPLYFAEPVYYTEQSYYGWYLRNVDDREYNDGIRVWRDTNQPDAMRVSLNVRITFETNDVTAITLYVTTCLPAGTTAQFSDVVNLAEA